MGKLRNFGIGCLSLATTLVTGYIVWVRTPAVQDPKYVEGVLKDNEARHKQKQLLQLDVENNMFHSNEFVGYWGRDGIERRADSSAETTIANWNASYSSMARGAKVDHQRLIQSPTPEERNAKKAFLALLPELDKALGRPYFIAPASSITFDPVEPNTFALRTIAHSLAGYAEHLNAEGKTGEAALRLQDIFHLGKALQGNGSLIQEMMATAISAIGFQATVTLLKPDSTLPPEQFDHLSRAILNSAPPPDAFLRMMEYQFFFSVESWKTQQKNSGNSGIDPTVFLPGVLDREERILKNNFAEFLKAIENNTLPQYTAQLNNLTFGSAFRGQTGIAASILIPNLVDVGKPVELNRKKLVGLATALKVVAHFRNAKSYPESLQQIGFSEETVPDWDKIRPTYRRVASKVTLAVSLTPEELKSTRRGDDKEALADWVHVEGNELIFRLNEL